jgi:L-amino acid N-acyltransferase YncA
VGAERAQHSPYQLRFAGPDDAVALAGIYAPYVRETTISFELEPPSADEMADRVRTVGEFHPWLVLELDGRVQAYAYASRWRTRPAYDWIAETSIYLARELIGRGLGEPLYRALLDLLALQGHWWAYGGIALPNKESQRFHARLGFEWLGCFPAVGYKFGRWCDLDWWRYRLAPVDADEAPAPVRAISDASLDAAIGERLARG